NAERGAFVEIDGTRQPAPAPRFSRTPSEIRRISPRPGQGGRELLAEWGFSAAEIDALAASGAVGEE
ncbi:MAG: CoA transferase, partial [Acidimicrobiia bacterium]|nr:CoA transferase [Acidimicrobiia bacterium]